MIHEIRDADSLLEYDKGKNYAWVLRVVSNKDSSGLIEEVSLVKLTKGKKEPEFRDFREIFQSVWAS